MEKLSIEKIDGRWTVNGKTYNELSPNERNALSNFIKDYEFSENNKSEVQICYKSGRNGIPLNHKCDCLGLCRESM